jgi:acetoin utilization protein AcuB
MTTTNEPTVAQFMTSLPASVDERFLLTDAYDRMYANNIRHLVVRSNGTDVTGVLSTRDVALALCAPKADPKKLEVADAMHKDPYVCGPTTPISEAALQMESHRYGCAIVVDGNELVGVFTTIDALRALRQLATGKPAERALEPTLVVEDRSSPNPHPEGILRRVRLQRHRAIDGQPGMMPGQGKIA